MRPFSRSEAATVGNTLSLEQARIRGLDTAASSPGSDLERLNLDLAKRIVIEESKRIFPERMFSNTHSQHEYDAWTEVMRKFFCATRAPTERERKQLEEQVLRDASRRLATLDIADRFDWGTAGYMTTL